MLGNVEEHTALSRALSQLAETEEKIEQMHKEQAEADFFVMAELMKDYVALMGAVKVSYSLLPSVFRYLLIAKILSLKLNTDECTCLFFMNVYNFQIYF